MYIQLSYKQPDGEIILFIYIILLYTILICSFDETIIIVGATMTCHVINTSTACILSTTYKNLQQYTSVLLYTIEQGKEPAWERDVITLFGFFSISCDWPVAH